MATGNSTSTGTRDAYPPPSGASFQSSHTQIKWVNLPHQLREHLFSDSVTAAGLRPGGRKLLCRKPPADASLNSWLRNCLTPCFGAYVVSNTCVSNFRDRA